MKNHITLKQKIVEILAYAFDVGIDCDWNYMVCKAAEGSGNTL